jgi:hypothetical protein
LMISFCFIARVFLLFFSFTFGALEIIWRNLKKDRIWARLSFLSPGSWTFASSPHVRRVPIKKKKYLNETNENE